MSEINAATSTQKTTDQRQLTFFGVIASPFQLKMQALADAVDAPWRRLPEEATGLGALASLCRIEWDKRLGRVQRYPSGVNELDEYPSVPFYWFDRDRPFYDSTGLALHLEALQDEPSLLPQDPATRFICRLIDEAFDEFGLYMAHHHRWVASAETNRMGVTTSRNIIGKLAPGFVQDWLARRLAMRQVGRCPYLFSIAPAGFDAGVAPEITPAPHGDFPQTHTLLDLSWRRYLAALEAILGAQPYILGQRFTLADASAYGQLGMHCIDGRAYRLIEERAPSTFAWIERIARAEHRNSEGPVRLDENLRDLLRAIADTFIPLMRQNERAYEDYRERGQTRFNQAAFDRGEALYDGELMGYRFRSVVKTFQVSCWRELCAEWRRLSPSDRQALGRFRPQLESEAFE